MGLTCFKSWKYNSATQKGGNRDVLVSPGSYFFLSNSCGQGEEWLKTLNKGVWIPFTGVFGQRLEETVLYERRYGVHMAPLVVEQCVDFIRERGLLEVGLFRQPGQATLVKELQDAFDAGEKPSFDSTDVHTVASLLKLYLRELPEPLVPFSRYQEFLVCGKNISSERKQGLTELQHLLHELPVANFNLLNYICQFLNEVQSYSSSNKMSTQNLATVFGPNILRPKAEDPESIIGGAAVVQQLMSELIREHQCLFSREWGNVDAPGSSRPDSYPCHRWKGDPFEGAHTQPTAQAQSHDSRLGITAERLLQQQLAHHPSPCSRQLSLPLVAERRGSAQSLCEISLAPRLFNTDHQQPAEGLFPVIPAVGSLYHRYTPSQSESQPPETAHSPHLHSHPASSLTASASTVTIQADPDHSSMLPSGWTGPECPSWAAKLGTTGTSGSSKAQDSTLSVYDNLDTLQSIDEVAADGDVGSTAGPVEVEAGMASVADTSSSWSFCEILPLDDSGSGVVRASLGRRSTRFHSFRTDPGEDLHPNSLASSSVPTDAPLSTGSSEVFLPSDPHGPPASQAMYCLLAGLRQEMARQRAEFEAKIQRFELRNEALHGEVVGLRASLAQQRRWYSVAEIKIRNVERARADADRRNATLQMEMEQFFDTFGELRDEASKSERIVQSF
ncbi:rho GTPase-activating protein 24 isoform X2 [Oncorhynchus mykiss]|uniref:rho GTPase-activating protein 24 isoform X2 n=1 Tax=Oncorhynchus mykiss TaxID=8022 RepID=UPI001878F33C|nr:rho GTPase-activating protein 24 isoform X2 [Oncorhynchus mykiss]